MAAGAAFASGPAPEKAGADAPADLVATACEARDSFVVDCTGGPRSSPFTCMRFDDACRVHVRIAHDETWYELLGVNGVSVEGVIEVARRHCDSGNWKKRLAEDLPALMEGVCRPFVAVSPRPEPTATASPATAGENRAEPSASAAAPPDPKATPSEADEAPAAQPPLVATVDLVLRDSEKGVVLRRPGVRSTPENRELVKACWPKEDRCPIQRDDRDDASGAPGERKEASERSTEEGDPPRSNDGSRSDH